MAYAVEFKMDGETHRRYYTHHVSVVGNMNYLKECGATDIFVAYIDKKPTGSMLERFYFWVTGYWSKLDWYRYEYKGR